MNLKYLIAATIAGGIALFVSGFIVHTALPVPQPIHEFTDPAAVSDFVRHHTTGNGMYFSMGGVFAAVNLRADGKDAFEMVPLLTGDFAIGLLTSFFLALVVLWTHVKSALGGGAFGALLALAAASGNILPEWNWYGFSQAYTAFETIDLLAGWILAGLAIGACRSWLAPPA